MVHKSNSPPDLDKYIKGKLHNFVTYEDGARLYSIPYWSFVNEKVSLSPEMAIRISKATNTSPESWMNMQQKLTLWTAQQNEPSNVIPFPLDTVKDG